VEIIQESKSTEHKGKKRNLSDDQARKINVFTEDGAKNIMKGVNNDNAGTKSLMAPKKCSISGTDVVAFSWPTLCSSCINVFIAAEFVDRGKRKFSFEWFRENSSGQVLFRNPHP